MFTVQIMVFIIGSNPEIGAHVRSNLCYLIRSRHYMFTAERSSSSFYDVHIHMFNVQIRVLILGGNSEIDAHVRSHLGYLICSRHLIRKLLHVHRRKKLFFFQ